MNIINIILSIMKISHHEMYPYYEITIKSKSHMYGLVIMYLLAHNTRLWPACF